MLPLLTLSVGARKARSGAVGPDLPGLPPDALVYVLQLLQSDLDAIDVCTSVRNWCLTRKGACDDYGEALYHALLDAFGHRRRAQPYGTSWESSFKRFCSEYGLLRKFVSLDEQKRLSDVKLIRAALPRWDALSQGEIDRTLASIEVVEPFLDAELTKQLFYEIDADGRPISTNSGDALAVTKTTLRQRGANTARGFVRDAWLRDMHLGIRDLWAAPNQLDTAHIEAFDGILAERRHHVSHPEEVRASTFEIDLNWETYKVVTTIFRVTLDSMELPHIAAILWISDRLIAEGMTDTDTYNPASEETPLRRLRADAIARLGTAAWPASGPPHLA
jgi:hypothetical protein